MELAWDPKRMTSAMRKHLRRATAINGKFAEAEVRQVIKSGRKLERNAALTIAIKGENKPLVGLTSEMFRAITSKVINDTAAFVGVLRTDDAFNIAEIVHDGHTIAVTPAMRGMFFVLWKASEGSMVPSKLTGRAAELWDQMPGGWKPLRKSTTAIVIPSRPFIDIAFESVNLKKRVEGNWNMAIQAAMREQANQ